MPHPDWLWAVFTLLATGGQTFRNATQKRLTAELGTAGATHVRFLYGLPFGLLALAGVAVSGDAIPAPNPAFFAWTVGGAISQIVATALMLAAMQERSFVVAIAYTKTEPVQVAIFATLFLGEALTLPLVAAILIATIGVVILSWPKRAGAEVLSWRPALLGIVSGGLFAIAAVAFRGGISALNDTDFVPAATLTLAVSLALQSALFSAWLVLRSPGVLGRVLRSWKESLPAGFLGAFASEMWFLAFAIQNPAKVRTLGLVEILIAALVSRRFFQQAPGLRDIAGMVLIVGGIALLFNA
jgi:drug/metabolite transporter (DMT)-like permease